MPRSNQGTRLLRLLGIIDMQRHVKANYNDADALIEALNIQQRHAEKDLTELDWARIGDYGDAALTKAENLIAEWAKREAEANHPLSAGH